MNRNTRNFKQKRNYDLINNMGVRHPTRDTNTRYRNPLNHENPLGRTPYDEQLEDYDKEAMAGNPNLGGRGVQQSYNSSNVYFDKDHVSQNVSDKIYSDAVCDSYNFANKRIMKDYTPIKNYLDLNLSNSNENNDLTRHIYYINDLTPFTNQLDFDAIFRLQSGYLRIHIDAFPEYNYSDELFINIKETTTNYGNGKLSGLSGYNFRLIQDSTLSNNGWITYKPDEYIFNLMTWQGLQTLTLVISNRSGPIKFEYPIKDAICSPGILITTITTTTNHNLVNGDQVYFTEINGLYPVTVIDNLTFTVPVSINCKKFIIYKLNFSYNIIFDNIKQNAMGAKC